MILICCEDMDEYGYGHRSRMIALIDIYNIFSKCEIE